MSQLSTLINELNPVIDGTRTTSDKIESIIIQHSVGSAAAGLAAGVFPGIGGVIATMVVYIYDQAFNSMNKMGYATAMSEFLFAGIMAVTILMYYIMNKTSD